MNTTTSALSPHPGLDDDVAAWMDHALSTTGSTAPTAPTEPASGAPLRTRLQARLATSREAEASMVTTRQRRQSPTPIAPGVSQRLLYQATAGAAQRAGEPLRVRLIDLAAGAVLEPGAFGDAALLQQRHREWLVLSGTLQFDGDTLVQRDYHVDPAGAPTPRIAARSPARLFLRESDTPAHADDRPHTVRDAEAGWPEFAPGIQRRVLWQRDGMAALLYRARAGVTVPHHTHGHDEDCLMVDGELFLDDLLLQAGDYQLAPVDTGHRITHTDIGAVIYAHGDLDLRFVD